MNDAIPLVSVLIPLFNKERFIIETLNSALNQTYKNIEIIVLNDGSTDNSRSLVESFISITKSSKIKLINSKNRGMTNTLNALIEESNGDYIAILDADDIASNDRIEKQINQIIEASADICGGSHIGISEEGKYIHCHLVSNNQQILNASLFKGVPFAHSTLLIKKQSIIKSNLYYSANYRGLEFADIGISDYIFYINSFEKKMVITSVQDFVLKYRIYSSSLSQIHSDYKLNFQKVRNKFVKNYSETSILFDKFHVDIMTLETYELEIYAFFLFKTIKLDFDNKIKILMKLPKRILVLTFSRILRKL
jgi:glycosyltransferase involved in cell wall biosynthesis